MGKIVKEKKGLAKPAISYRKIRPNNIMSDEYKHMLYLLFWPIFMATFYYIELLYPTHYEMITGKALTYFPMHSVLDEMIPFAEIFAVPYMFWFIFVFLMHIYTLYYDIDAFKKMIKFIIFSYSIALATFIIFPNCQQLRPDVVVRDNIFATVVRGIYEADTNTNVCPSIHVLGSVAVMFAGLEAKTIKSVAWKVAISVMAILICFSTVFLKQHSVLDVLAAVPVCIIGYYLFFAKKSKKRKADFSNENAVEM